MTYFSKSDEARLKKATRQVVEDITASFTVTYETKLNGIAPGATVGASWGLNITGKPGVVSQAEAEAGSATTERTWTSQRVKQAIAVNGYVVGPANAALNEIPVFSDVNGKVIGSGSDIYIVNGKLGIGGTPDQDFQITRDNSATFECSVRKNTSGGVCKFQAVRGRGSHATPLPLQDGDKIFQISSRGVDTSFGGDILAANLQVFVDGPVSSNKVPGRFLFETKQKDGAFTEKFEVGSDSVTALLRFRKKRLSTGVNATTAGQNIVGVTDTSVARTITIATADILNMDGNIITVKDESGGAGTNNITVDTEGSETIDGSETATINSNYGVLRLYSDGANLFTM